MKEARLKAAFLAYARQMAWSPYLSAPIVDLDASRHSSKPTPKLMGLDAGCCAVQGWRTGQEDAHVAEPDFGASLGLFAVFDGHGGAEVARYAAAHVGAYLKRAPGFAEGDYGAALRAAFFALDASLRWPPLIRRGRGVVALVDRAAGVVYVANAGDSRAILLRAGGAAPAALSEDHKPEDDRERSRVEAAGGVVTPEGRVDGNLNLSRAFGDHRYKMEPGLAPERQRISCEPDVVVAPLSNKDVGLALVCDGVTGCLPDATVASVLGDGDVVDAARDLAAACVADTAEGDGTAAQRHAAAVRFVGGPKRPKQARPAAARLRLKRLRSFATTTASSTRRASRGTAAGQSGIFEFGSSWSARATPTRGGAAPPAASAANHVS
ncbi:protein serine/threonine phosphatase [Aureococcus anophagefferens]|nr:protein serine/threonine phosphatase [Aureococcus anophagefferens]